jgi:hypothetical protein
VSLVQLRSRVANIDRRAGKPVLESEVKLLLTGDADVYKPSGEPLCLLRRGAIDPALCEQAREALLATKKYGSGNRANYGGGVARNQVKKDGTLSRSTSIHDPETGERRAAILSSCLGYFERQGGRFPYCRESSFVGKQAEQWQTILPMIDRAGVVFSTEMPQRYAKQFEVAERVNPAFRIGRTPFTTITVNNNVVGAIHQDKGDYKEGFGIISVVRRGKYSGGWLVFPEYEVAADLRDGDLIFFNSHDWHGVTKFYDNDPDFERISIVYYLRTRMTECGTPVEEMERARKRYGGIE